MENTFPKAIEIIAENILRCAIYNTNKVTFVQRSVLNIYLHHEDRVQSTFKLNFHEPEYRGHVYEVERIEGRFFYKVDDVNILIRC